MRAEKCVTLCHMERASVRDLHLKTTALLKSVSDGHSFIIERHGVPVAELRPISEERKGRPLADREAYFRRLKPSKGDAGRMLEEDRR